MYYFIVNPKSKSGRSLKLWEEIKATLETQGLAYRVSFTKHLGHGTELAAKLGADPAEKTVVVLGGDGTMNEVINGLWGKPHITLGYVPTGSSNDLARGLGITTDHQKALEMILHPRQIMTLDLGQVTYGENQRVFGCSMGIGFDAAVCAQALKSKIKDFFNKIHMGKLTYLGIALYQLLFAKIGPMELTMDDGVCHRYEKAFFISVHNNKYEGGGFMFCPKADMSDGLLDVCVAEGLSRLKIIALLPTAFAGNHVKYKGIHTYQGTAVEIKSQLLLDVHADGESCAKQYHVKVSCLPKTIKIING